MTTRTWHGGRGNNQASSPKNWSPNGAPRPGDTLTMTGGTMNITGGNSLGADVLYMSGKSTVSLQNTSGEHLQTTAPGNIARPDTDATINLTNTSGVVIRNGSGHLTINAQGTNDLDLSTPYRAFWSGSVDIHNSGTLVGGISGFATTYRLDGGAFYNTGSTVGNDTQSETINADVLGTGVFHMSTFHGGVGKLEFMQSVGPGQTISFENGLGVYNLLEIDRPSDFHGSIVVGASSNGSSSIVDLNGLAADSYSSANGVLDFFQGNTLVDEVRYNSAQPFTVAQGTSAGTAGIEIYALSNPNASVPHGADLPLHA